jgi:GNAT superfamily N-acetyltransferase
LCSAVLGRDRQGVASGTVDVDLPLIRRLESSAASSTVRLVDALRSTAPETAADARVAFDGALIAMGPGRFVNRALGVTLAERSAADIDAIEQFYADHGLPAAVELASWAPASVVDELARRNFRTAWFRAMFAIVPGSSSAEPAADVQVELVDESTAARWMQVYADAFSFTDDHARAISDEFARATMAVRDIHTFLATIDGRPAGCGALHVADGIGWVGGAATVPSLRRRGVQSTLLAHRLRLAGELGLDLVAATAIPSGASARNLVHLGFQLVQTQVAVVQST